MKVLHVIDSLSGSGGAENGLVREITRFKGEVRQLVATLYGYGELLSHLDAFGIQTVCLDLSSSNSGWNWPAGARRLRAVIRDFQPHVVQSSLASGNLVAQLAARNSRVPVLSTLTLSGDPALMRRYQPGAASRRAGALRRVGGVSARQDHVWFRALTLDAKKTSCAAADIDEARVAVIPRGIPMPDLRRPPASRTELGLPESVPVILNVGRQSAQKGHPHLVRSFALLRRRGPAHLVILGREGDGSGALRSAISAHGLENDVTIIAYTNRVIDYCRQANVFAFTSLMEGLGTAVIEAMGAGLPVVAFDIPPVREVTDGGRVATLVEVGNELAMAEALSAAIGDEAPEARRRAEEARRWVEKSYSIDSVANRVETRLQELAASATGVPG